MNIRHTTLPFGPGTRIVLGRPTRQTGKIEVRPNDPEDRLHTGSVTLGPDTDAKDFEVKTVQLTRAQSHAYVQAALLQMMGQATSMCQGLLGQLAGSHGAAAMLGAPAFLARDIVQSADKPTISYELPRQGSHPHRAPEAWLVYEPAQGPACASFVASPLQPAPAAVRKQAVGS